MGTNFKWAKIPLVDGAHISWKSNKLFDEYGVEAGAIHDEDNPVLHIGKRSAAGPFCWNCNKTLCKEGNQGIHYGCHHEIGCNCKWYDACPDCGKKHNPNSTHLEGYRPSGVESCCSFSWAQEPEFVRMLCTVFADKEIILDEYERKLTGREFLTMIEINCPVQFTDSIGVTFC